MLNDRQEKILELLNENGIWMKGNILSALLHVSVRTIRNDIVKINEEKNNCILSSAQNGYSLKELRETAVEYSHIDDSQERVRYILQALLFAKEELHVVYFTNRLYISEFTLENDIRKVKEIIKDFPGLHLKRVKNCITMDGPEAQKRKLYKFMLDAETKGNFLNIHMIASLFPDFDLLIMKDFLEQALQEVGLHIREQAFPMVMMHAGIAIQRIIKGNVIHKDTLHLEVKESKEYEAAKIFYSHVEAYFHQTVNELEKITLASLIMGKKGLAQNESQGTMQEEALLVDDILQMLYANYDMNFKEDEDLQVGLTLHLHSLLYRMNNNIQTPNVFLADIKKRYPLVFDMAVQICNMLSKKLDCKIDENEIGFIALHFGTAYERNHTEESYKAVLIMPHEHTFIEFCKNRIVEKFCDRLEIVETFTMIDEVKLQRLNPDFIITTTSFHSNLNILTVQISAFVDKEDESMIFQALNKLDKLHVQSIVHKRLYSYMNPRYFYSDMEFDDARDVIAYMCDNLWRDQQVDEDFKDSVLEREAMSSTSFFYSFATPHALYCQALSSNISIMILRKPILWGDFQVKLVLLLALQKKDKEILKVIFDWLSQAIKDMNHFQRMLQAKSYDEFIHLLTHSE